MGIDAQRSGASELPDRAVEVMRGRIAYSLPSGCPGTPWYARCELGRATAAVRTSDEPSRRKAMSVRIVDDEQRKRSPAFWAVQPFPNERWQSPARPMRPPGSGGAAHLRRCRPSTMYTDI